MRRLLLDTANLDEIRFWTKTSAVSGVTTNPSLMAKEEKGNYLDRIIEIVSICEKTHPHNHRNHLSVEVTTLDPQEMFEQACSIAKELEATEHAQARQINFHIKIPVLPDTLDVITALSKRGIMVNATACMTTMQAKIASEAGADVVSFFFNRMIDGFLADSSFHGEPRKHALLEITKYYQLEGSAKVICGSIRKPQDVWDCWTAGAEYVTASPLIIRQMITHPQTDKAVKQFQEDIEKWLS